MPLSGTRPRQTEPGGRSGGITSAMFCAIIDRSGACESGEDCLRPMIDVDVDSTSIAAK
jgi:hypothetical protein